MLTNCVFEKTIGSVYPGITAAYSNYRLRFNNLTSFQDQITSLQDKLVLIPLIPLQLPENYRVFGYGLLQYLVHNDY